MIMRKKTVSVEKILLIIFFIATFLFAVSLIFFSKRAAADYKITSVDELLRKVSSENFQNAAEVDYTLSAQNVLDDPQKHIDKTVSWQGEVTNIAEQKYAGVSLKLFKIMSADGVEFIASAEGQATYKTGDILRVKGVFKGVYMYKDGAENGMKLLVLKGVEFEVNKKVSPSKDKKEKDKSEKVKPAPAEEKKTTKISPAPVSAPKPSYAEKQIQWNYPPQKAAPKPKNTPKQEIKTVKIDPRYEYKYSGITQLDQKYLKIAESYEKDNKNENALMYYKKYLEVAPQARNAEDIKVKIKQLELEKR